MNNHSRLQEMGNPSTITKAKRLFYAVLSTYQQKCVRLCLANVIAFFLFQNCLDCVLQKGVTLSLAKRCEFVPCKKVCVCVLQKDVTLFLAKRWAFVSCKNARLSRLQNKCAFVPCVLFVFCDLISQQHFCMYKGSIVMLCCSFDYS